MGYFVVSPDGRHVAFTASDPAGPRTIWVHSLESGVSRPLPRAGDLSSSSIIWSGDSRFIGFVGSQGRLAKIDINGDPAQEIGRASRIPDHTAIYVGSVDASPDEQPSQPVLVTDSRPA